VGGQHHAPAALVPRYNTGYHLTGGWVGLSAGLDGLHKGTVFFTVTIRTPGSSSP